jgi:hypothetical protein
MSEESKIVKISEEQKQKPKRNYDPAQLEKAREKAREVVAAKRAASEAIKQEQTEIAQKYPEQDTSDEEPEPEIPQYVPIPLPQKKKKVPVKKVVKKVVKVSPPPIAEEYEEEEEEQEQESIKVLHPELKAYVRTKIKKYMTQSAPIPLPQQNQYVPYQTGTYNDALVIAQDRVKSKLSKELNDAVYSSIFPLG